MIARFADAPELALREQVAGALVNTGVTLGVLGRSEEAVGVFDEVIARSSLARDHRVAAGRVLEAAAAAGVSEDDVIEMASVMGTERAALAELIAAEVKRPA